MSLLPYSKMNSKKQLQKKKKIKQQKEFITDAGNRYIMSAQVTKIPGRDFGGFTSYSVSSVGKDMLLVQIAPHEPWSFMEPAGHSPASESKRQTAITKTSLFTSCYFS